MPTLTDLIQSPSPAAESQPEKNWPEKPCPRCSCPIFWAGSSGLFRCLNCSPPAGKHLMVDVIDLVAMADDVAASHQATPTRTTGGVAGWSRRGGGDVDWRQFADADEIFSLPGPHVFLGWDGKWHGTAREAMGLGKWPEKLQEMA